MRCSDSLLAERERKWMDIFRFYLVDVPEHSIQAFGPADPLRIIKILIAVLLISTIQFINHHDKDSV
jgi:hypothetical protein